MSGRIYACNEDSMRKTHMSSDDSPKRRLARPLCNKQHGKQRYGRENLNFLARYSGPDVGRESR